MRKLKNEELNRLTPEAFRAHPKNPVILLLDDVRSLHNVGSAFRTADAFLLEKIVLCGITGSPPHREINKTALGATESVTWEYHPDAVTAAAELKSSGHRLVAVEQADESISLNKFSPDPNGKYVLIFGNEVKGVKDELVGMADHVVEIPQSGTKHSLNISVSIGIVVWDFLNKMKTK
ncbi:MAG TPA: RNA methyltransferase [Cyclobacteriaceae bacterium]|nr:RNA methyltransferase [Cyclobacteriaceae bacterium]